MANKADAAQEKLFRKFRGGDSTSLFDLLETERQDLYDYLMRMTGQVSRSADTVDEVFQSLSSDILETLASYTELKVCLYTTARKFNADIWNAETTKLVNIALETSRVPLQLSDAEIESRKSHKGMDRALRLLPGREREPLILYVRSRLSHASIEEIMALPAGEAQNLIALALRRVRREHPDQAGSYEVALTCLPHHPAPVRSSQMTMNLSDVMQGIKAKPVGLRSRRRLAMLIVAIALVVGGIFYPEVYSKVLAMARHAALEALR